MAPPAHPVQSRRDGHEVVIVGGGEQAEIAYEYLTHDSPHTVAGFAVERPFVDGNERFGLPLVALEDLAERFATERYRSLVAVSSTQLNGLRARLFAEVKRQGFECVSYVSSRASVWHDVELGENCFVFENCVLERKVQLGDDVVVWSGALIAHRSTVGSHCFLAPGAAVAGFCRIGEGSFLGINSCVADGRVVAPHSIVGAGAVVIADTEPRSVNVGNPARATGRDSFDAAASPRERPSA